MNPENSSETEFYQKSYAYIENPYIIQDNTIKSVDDPYPKIDPVVGKIFIETFERDPNHIYQIDVDKNEKTTFAQMKDASIRAALWLRQQNVKSGDVISICANLRTDNFVPLLASFYEGAIFCPWHHDMTLMVARRSMKLIEPKIMFCIEEIADVLIKAAELENVNTKFVVFGKYPGISSLDDILSSQSAEDVKNYSPKRVRSLKDGAVIIFSSGSTGFPKGVLHSYESVFKNFFCCHIFAKKYSKTLFYSTMVWISGTMWVLVGILNLCTRYIHQKFDVHKTSEIIEANKIDWVFLRPMDITQYVKSQVLSCRKYGLQSVKVIITGGSRINPDILKDFRKSLPHALVANSWGLTEVGGVVSCQRKNIDVTSSSIGTILPYTELKIINKETGKTLSLSEIGELCVRRPIIMSGYYRNLDATREAIDKEGWFYTGDYGYFKNNGDIVFTDRLKDMMKFQQHQVSGSELESLVLTHEDVVDVAVTSISDMIDGDRPMAFVIKKPESKVSEEELVDLSSQLGYHSKLWGGVKFVEKLPITHSGKIDKRKLKEMAETYIQS